MQLLMLPLSLFEFLFFSAIYLGIFLVNFSEHPIILGGIVLKYFPGDPSGKESACQCGGHQRHRFDP